MATELKTNGDGWEMEQLLEKDKMNGQYRGRAHKSLMMSSTGATPLPEIVPKKTTLNTETALKGCIELVIPAFRECAARRDFVLCSDPLSLAGFRWALRVKGTRRMGQQRPGILSLWLWAQGPEGGERLWDVTAQMTFRVKYHYSAKMDKLPHIEHHSCPTEFTNRTNPAKTMFGFSMAELDFLADPRNGFVFRKQDHLYVEVVFVIQRTNYTLK